MLKPATKKRLAKLALQSGRSANYLVADAVETYLADQERLRVDLRFSAFACGFLLFLSRHFSRHFLPTNLSRAVNALPCPPVNVP